MRRMIIQQKEKSGFIEVFSIWFDLGALMFDTFCGTNMAPGVYAPTYAVTLGGSWALVWLLMFLAAMSFFYGVGLNSVRICKITNYNAYYPALYGPCKPDANPVLGGIVTVFFDFYTMMVGPVTIAATVTLFFELMNTLFGIPSVIANIFGVLLFTVLSIYDTAFLRRFSTLMTVSLTMSLVSILVAVTSIRGPVLMEHIENFDIGMDWTGTAMTTYFSMFFSYCMACSSWGSTLNDYSDQIWGKKDAIGSGITISLLVILLFAMTGTIVFPFMPEIVSGTPILLICEQYLPAVFTTIYRMVVVLAVVSTAPNFTYNFSNHWAAVWKTGRFSYKARFLILSMDFLLTCWLISSVGLVTIAQRGYVMLGNVALFTVMIPLLISTCHVWKKDHAHEENDLNS